MATISEGEEEEEDSTMSDGDDREFNTLTSEVQTFCSKKTTHRQRWKIIKTKTWKTQNK